ncbi:unnamed protein product [Caenorhabditis brenneri]
MSDTSTVDTGKSTEQLEDDLSGAMTQLSVTTGSSDNCLKSPKNLSDMPFDVVGLIIERSDYKEQLILRKVSKTLRALVDKQKPSCKLIKAEFFIQNVIITFNNHFVMYTDDEDMFVGNAEGTEIMIRRNDFLKVAFDDLASTLKNPKLQLAELSFRFSYAQKKDIKRFYNKIQKICYDRVGDWIIGPTGMDQVALLEQWKQAEELGLEDSFDRFPLKHATHFKRFRIFESVIDPGTFDRIKNFLSELEDFEYCRIAHSGRDNIDDVQRMTGIPVPPNMSHYSIPDSDYCLEFSFEAKSVKIVKKKCRLH